jgi:anaerobic selenocysteine-containing dehydrogenase
MLPDATRVDEALRSRELSVVVDTWLSDTARAAHVVLPTTTMLEDDDLLGAYGHHYVGASRPVVSPPAGVKGDLEIVRELARRVGLGDAFDLDARELKRRMVEHKLARHGVTLEELEAGVVQNPMAPRVLFADRRFPTATGRMQLVGTPPASPPPRDDRYPLTLMALSTRHSQSSVWATGHPSEPLAVSVHPESIPGGMEEGDLVRVVSDRGSLVARLRVDATVRRDVALMPKGGHLVAGACANALIAAECTDLGEGGVLYDQGVALHAIA